MALRSNGHAMSDQAAEFAGCFACDRPCWSRRCARNLATGQSWASYLALLLAVVAASACGSPDSSSPAPDTADSIGLELPDVVDATGDLPSVKDAASYDTKGLIGYPAWTQAGDFCHDMTQNVCWTWHDCCYPHENPDAPCSPWCGPWTGEQAAMIEVVDSGQLVWTVKGRDYCNAQLAAAAMECSAGAWRAAARACLAYWLDLAGIGDSCISRFPFGCAAGYGLCVPHGPEGPATCLAAGYVGQACGKDKPCRALLDCRQAPPDSASAQVCVEPGTTCWGQDLCPLHTDCVAGQCVPSPGAGFGSICAL